MPAKWLRAKDMTMRTRISMAFDAWESLMAKLRGLPFIDFVMAYIQVGWASIAFYDWRYIVTTSRFYSMTFVVHYMAVLVFLSGALQGVAGALGMPRLRRVGAFFGLWIFVTFMCNINSPLGIVLWSAMSFVQFLLLASVID